MIADYQFGFGCGAAIFDNTCTFVLSKTKRIKQVLCNKKRLATLRSKDGFITLSIEGAKRLHSYLEYPKQRVIVSNEAVPYVSCGKTLFSKHVVLIDENLRCKDEVLVVDSFDNFIATGQLLLSPLEIMNSDFGAAVAIRFGINQNTKD